MSDEQQHLERRQHPRFDLEYTIQLIGRDGGMVVTAMTSNISDGGVRLPLPAECLPDKGQEVQVNLTVRRNSTGEVEMYTGMGQVLRHTQQNENGEAEVVLRFNAPMDLKLEEAQNVPPPVGL
jgi:hypothetical protein